MQSNSSVTLLSARGQWLHPVQLGTTTVMEMSRSRATIDNILTILQQLEADEYIDFMKDYYKAGLARFGDFWGYTDQLTVLHAATKLLQPKAYLEIGVFRGRSMSIVAQNAPECDLFGFDLWIENYSNLPNTGPDFVRSQLQRVGHRGSISLISGNSHETVPQFLDAHPDLFFDLITVDGDHSEEGARIDLENVLARVKQGGMLIFDDIRHPKHPWLERVWDEAVGANLNFLAAKYTEVGHGVAFAIRRDTNAKLDTVRGSADLRIRQLNALLEEARAKIDELQEQCAFVEQDRATRLEVIERQGAELGRISALEADIAFLKEQLQASEADRTARLAVIERQGAELGQMQQRVAVAEHQAAQMRRVILNVDQILGRRKLDLVLNSLRLPAWSLVQADIKRILVPNGAEGPRPAGASHAGVPLAAYVAQIDRFNGAQPNAELLNAIRAYNHSMLDQFNTMRSLRGKRLLDIGASPHGYALERALQLGVAEYVGIGLDVNHAAEVRAEESVGRLLCMDATQLSFEDEHFDLVVSLSTFEHINDVPAALEEIWRVLRPGGTALISFEPVWTCSYGHHLHHFGPVAKLMPDWAHLIWDKQQMLHELAPIWPADAPLSLEDAAHWVYESSAINRVGIVQMRAYFTNCSLAIEWIAPIPDAKREPKRLREVAAVVSLSSADLMTKGLSILLNKAANLTSSNGYLARSSSC